MMMRPCGLFLLARTAHGLSQLLGWRCRSWRQRPSRPEYVIRNSGFVSHHWRRDHWPAKLSDSADAECCGGLFP